MPSLLLACLLSLGQDESEIALELLAPPALEEVLAEVPASRPFEEVLALPSRPDAEAWRERWDRLQVTVVTMYSLGATERGGERLKSFRAELAEALGAEHALVGSVDAALAEHAVRVSASGDQKEALREADGRMLEVGLFFGQGRFAEARGAALEALLYQLDVFGPASESVALSCGNVARIAHELRQPRIEERFVLAAVSLRRELFGEDHPLVADALHHLGEVLLKRQRFLPAERVQRRALEISAMTYGPDSPNALPTVNGLAHLCFELDRKEEARQLWEACADHADSLSDQDAATVFDNLGVLLHQDFGELSRAEEFHRKALALRRQRSGPAGSTNLATGLMNLAGLVEARGDYAEAELLCREALTMRERLLGTDDPSTARARGGLAELLQRRGDLAGALKQGRLAVSTLSTHAARDTDLARELRNRADVLREADRLEEARASALQARALFTRALGPAHSEVAQCWSQLSAIELAEGHLEEAREGAETALRLLRDTVGPGHYSIAAELERLGHLDRLEQRWASARRRYEEALDLLRRSAGPNAPGAVRLLRALAEVAVSEGRTRDALARWREAFERADEVRDHVVGDERARALFAARIEHRSLSRTLAFALAREGAAEESLSVLERGRDRVLEDLLARAQGGPAEAEHAPLELPARLAEEARARGEVSSLEKGRALLLDRGLEERAASLERDLELARRRLDSAEQAVRAALGRRWAATKPATVAEMRDSLRAGELLLSFGWEPRGVVATTAGPAGAGAPSSYVLAAGEADVTRLEQLVETLEASWAVGGEDPSAARELADALLPPLLRRSVRDSERVVLIPDGPLSGLPFEALPLGGDETPWLVDGPEVVLVSSASLFIDRRRHASAQAQRTPPSLVAVGDPEAPSRPGDESGPGEAGEGLAALPGSRAEALRIGARFEAAGGTAEVLLGAEATVDRVRAVSPGATYVHLACHGVAATADDPFGSGLDLADGRWTLAELLRSDGGRFADAELIVLAACETQHGTRLGDADISLPWGFLAAGAPGVVVSLWRVDDASTALLMERFYGNVLGDHSAEREVGGRRFGAGVALPPVAALREAKGWLRSRTPRENRARLAALGVAPGSTRDAGGPPGPDAPPQALPAALDFSSPRHWAAFVLFGAPD